MGNTSYNVSDRTIRASAMAYASNTINENFKQNVVRRIHESMEPKSALLRESRDSAAHPNTVPIIMALDVTGSMGRIPQQLIQDGLPKMMSGIIEHGTKDAALLFLAIGDTTVDHYPLQVGQFESGDLELDTWLTRTYLEGGGGGNAGESYMLAWYYASHHTQTDAWDKRSQKGFLFTVGDEPCLDTLPQNHISSLMGTTPQAGFTKEELLKSVQEKWNVFHIHVNHDGQSNEALKGWKTLLGQKCVEVTDYTRIPNVIAEIVTSGKDEFVPVKKQEAQEGKKDEIYL